MLSVLGCAQKRKLHLLWLLSQSPLYWAKDIFQAHMFRFFPIGFWFYPESHMRERGMSQIPNYAQECINSSKHLLPGLLIRPCLSSQFRTVPVWSNASTVKAAQGGTPPHHWILIDRQALAKPGSSCARAALAYHWGSGTPVPSHFNRSHDPKAKQFHEVCRKWFSQCLYFWLLKRLASLYWLW